MLGERGGEGLGEGERAGGFVGGSQLRQFGIDGHDSAVEFRSQLDSGDSGTTWSEWSPASTRGA